MFASTFVAYGPGHATAEAAQAGFWANYGLMIVSGVLAIVGIAAAYLLYVQETWIPGLVKASAMPACRTLWNKYYVDELYEAGVVKPARNAGRVCVGLDDYLIDGLVWLATAVPRGIGYALRTFQSGVLQGYGLSMVTGIAVIVLVVFWI